MPFPPHAPSIYFESDDISQFIEALSEKLRADKRLRPSLDRLVGNQWYAFEIEVKRFIGSTLFMSESPSVDLQFLYRVSCLLSAEDIEIIADIFLDVCLSLFPLLSAAALNDLAERLTELIIPIVNAQDLHSRQRALLAFHQKLTSGSLFSGV